MGRIKTLLRNINYISKHSLWDQREGDIVFLSNKILDDVAYEYDLRRQGFTPHILDGEESLDIIINSNKSFVRTGDGEIKIMMGMDQPFQKYDKDLADGLRRILYASDNRILVGVNRNYYLSGSEYNYSPFYRRFAYEYRKYYESLLNPDVTYIDSTLTSFRFGSHENIKTIERYRKWREAFKNKNIVIVCGVGILQKLEYDIFELAANKIIIEAPKRDAWSSRKEIIEEIENKADKDSLLVFILGMAGKVMIPDLVEKGYTCWDVGHLAKYYDAFKKGMEGNEGNIKQFYSPD